MGIPRSRPASSWEEYNTPYSVETLKYGRERYHFNSMPLSSQRYLAYSNGEDSGIAENPTWDGTTDNQRYITYSDDNGELFPGGNQSFAPRLPTLPGAYSNVIGDTYDKNDWYIEPEYRWELNGVYSEEGGDVSYSDNVNYSLYGVHQGVKTFQGFLKSANTEQTMGVNWKLYDMYDEYLRQGYSQLQSADDKPYEHYLKGWSDLERRTGLASERLKRLGMSALTEAERDAEHDALKNRASSARRNQGIDVTRIQPDVVNESDSVKKIQPVGLRAPQVSEGGLFR